MEPQRGVRANTDRAVDVNASTDPLGHQTGEEDIISADDSEPEPLRPWIDPRALKIAMKRSIPSPKGGSNVFHPV